VKTKVGIHECEMTMIAGSIHQLINPGKKKMIFKTILI